MFEWYYYLLLGLTPGIIIILIGLMQKQKNCPKCNTPLPKLRKPKNLIQAFGGGWTCSKCGCNLDRRGNEIIDYKQYEIKSKQKIKIAIIVFVVLILILIGGFFLYIDYSFYPYKYSSNPELCEKFIEGNVFRGECFYEMAIKNNDVSLCSEVDILNRADCYSYFATEE